MWVLRPYNLPNLHPISIPLIIVETKMSYTLQFVPIIKVKFLLATLA